jgi:RHS repeat-associated protein
LTGGHRDFIFTLLWPRAVDRYRRNLTTITMSIIYLLLGVLIFSHFIPPLYASTTHYNHADHLNSTRAITDQSGEVENIYEYSPFGVKNIDDTVGSFDEQRQFGSYETSQSSDLYYLGARFLSPAIGKFLSADPLSRDKPEQVLGDPQQLNYYSYGRNNPLRYIDENGEAAKDFRRLSPTTALFMPTGTPALINNRQAFTFEAGTSMGTYKGVPLLSNGERTGTGAGPDRQQCVGFVKAFYKQVYGVDIGRVVSATGLTTTTRINSVSFDRSGARSFKEYRNGLSTVLPREDDLIGWRGGNYGHAGVVVTVNFNATKNSGFMDVAEQNWGRGALNQNPISRHRISRDPDSGRITVADRSSYQLYNWLRLETQ